MPKAWAWLLSATLVQLKTGLRLQTGTKFGFFKRSKTSTDKAIDAIVTIMPPINRSQGRVDSKVLFGFTCAFAITYIISAHCPIPVGSVTVVL
jgi:hypothetical protein